MTDSAPVTPRTEAGSKIMHRIGYLHAEGELLSNDDVAYIRAAVVAIEREGAAPGTEALRAAERRVHVLTALLAASPEPGPTPDSGLAAVLAREASAEGSPHAESFRRSTPEGDGSDG